MAAQTPEGGRRTRAALAEIPLYLDRLRVTPQPPAVVIPQLGLGRATQPATPQPGRATTLARATPLQPLTNTRLTPNTRERSPALPPGYLSPAASPDEMLIQQRGMMCF